MLKTASLALGFLLGLSSLGRTAVAASLLTGEVRDTQGFAIAGAAITGFDGTGAALGRVTTDTDGTFALDTSSPPTSVRVECAYCGAVTVRVRADEPLVVIVRRYATIASGAVSARDLAALPYARIENALALRPFTVLHHEAAVPSALYPALSDRGLARSALIIDGEAPAYDLGSATMTALAAIPAHAGDAATVDPAANAYRYGIYGAGGTIAFSRDPTELSQLAFGSAGSLRLSASSARAGFSLGSDADDLAQRARLLAGAQRDLFGGTLEGSVSASRADLVQPDVRISERSATLAYDRAFDRVRLHLSAANAFGTSTLRPLSALNNVWSDSIVGGNAIARVGAVDLVGGASHLSASAADAGEGARYDQDVVYAEAHVRGRTRVDAALGETFLNFYEGTTRSVPLPSLMLTQSLGAFELVVGLSRALLATAASAPVAVTSLSELHLIYADGRRLRAEIQSYRRTSESQAPIAGSGASLAYQLTPSTSVRAWTLRMFGDAPELAGTTILVEPFVSGDSFWVTHDDGRLRIDAIYRRTAGLTRRTAVEGDAYFPISRTSALGIRTELRPQGRRSSLVFSLTP